MKEAASWEAALKEVASWEAALKEVASWEAALKEVAGSLEGGSLEGVLRAVLGQPQRSPKAVSRQSQGSLRAVLGQPQRNPKAFPEPWAAKSEDSELRAAVLSPAKWAASVPIVWSAWPAGLKSEDSELQRPRNKFRVFRFWALRFAGVFCPPFLWSPRGQGGRGEGQRLDKLPDSPRDLCLPLYALGTCAPPSVPPRDLCGLPLQPLGTCAPPPWNHEGRRNSTELVIVDTTCHGCHGCHGCRWVLSRPPWGHKRGGRGERLQKRAWEAWEAWEGRAANGFSQTLAEKGLGGLGSLGRPSWPTFRARSGATFRP